MTSLGRPKKDPSEKKVHITATVSPELGKSSKAYTVYREKINPPPTYSDCVEMGLRKVFDIPERKEENKATVG